VIRVYRDGSAGTERLMDASAGPEASGAAGPDQAPADAPGGGPGASNTR
jgi:hypothetical protein